MDIEAKLKILENSNWDLITFVMNIQFGINWVDNLKISSDRIRKWEKG